MDNVSFFFFLSFLPMEEDDNVGMVTFFFGCWLILNFFPSSPLFFLKLGFLFYHNTANHFAVPDSEHGLTCVR